MSGKKAGERLSGHGRTTIPETRRRAQEKAKLVQAAFQKARGQLVQELSPVLEVDGRQIGSGGKGPMTQRLQDLHAAWVRSHGTALPF